MKIVVIGDTHSHPDYDNKRFRALGEFAAEELQGAGDDGYIVQIGDWADVCAFNSHGTKLEMEGSRWKDDIEVTQDSLAEFMAPFYRRRRKLPKRYITLGNHEHRVNRWIAQEPKFEGTMSVQDLGFEEFGFECIPYGQMLNLGGVNFVHHLGTQTGAAAKISSPTNGVKSIGVSTVVGHSHSADYIPVYYRDRTVHGIDAGCAIHKTMGYDEGWSHQSAHKYRRCVWILENVHAGDFNFRQIRLEDLGV